MSIPIGPPPGSARPGGPAAGAPFPAAGAPAAGAPTAAPGPARPLVPRHRASLYVPANLLVLAWFVAAGVITLAHRFTPAAGWLMVHLLLLGGVSTAILLWSQHFAETLLRRPAPGGRPILWARLLGWSVGAALVTAGIFLDASGNPAAGPLVIAGASVCAVVALGHLAVLALQRRGSTRLLGNRFAHLVRYYLAATALLPLGVAAGVLLARTTTTPEVTGRLYLAHVVLTLLGWVGLTVAGTVVLLWPTVLHTRIEPAADRDGRRALWIMAGGIAVVLAAAGTGVRVLAGPGCLVVAAGIVLLGRHAVAQARAAGQAAGASSGTGGGFASWSVGASLVWFAVCVVALGVTVVHAPSWAAVPDSLTDLVAPFAAGFVAQVMLGSMTYLLPVVLGGGPGAVRWSIDAMGRWGAARLVVLNACVALFALPLPSWVAVAVSTLGLGALLTFLVIALRVVLVQRRGEKRTLAAGGAGSTAAGAALPGHHGATRTRTRTLAGAGVGAALVALAVVGGVAADPLAAGLTALPATSAAAPVAAAAATGETTTVTVTMANMTFSPHVIEVPAGNTLVIELVNEGDQVHDLVLANGASSGRVFPGNSVTVEAGVVTGDVDGWCSVAGHRLMGMTLTVVATGGTTTAEGAAPSSSSAAENEAGGGEGDGATDHGGHAGMDHVSGDGASIDSATVMAALMGEAPEGFEPRSAVLPPAATSGTDAQGMTSEPDPDGVGTLHRLTMVVGEAEVEVAPGITQTLWTFNGTAPGPILRGKVGDTFVITLVNDGTIGHSIDFHAGALAPDEPMRTISPGEELTYTFRAERSGIWMYHCGTMPMSLHIANGMFGGVIIDPEGLAEVDREYVLIQNEYYLGAPAGEADPAKIATQNPDLVTFNGYGNAYRFAPLEATVGERVRFWVLDVGPNRPSSFHIVGGQFDTVFLEGDYTLRDGGSTGTGGSQALGLQAAQGGFVELAFPEAGHYSFVTHIMSDAEKGAGGVIAVTD